MKRLALVSVLALTTAVPALASSRFDAVYVDPVNGSDANNCRVVPYTGPEPKPCKTITHAATLLTGPGSAIFLTGTFNEQAAVNVDAKRFPAAGAALAIGKAPNNTASFDGGTFTLYGDGWLSGPRGVTMQNCPTDCITAMGTTPTTPLHGGVFNENIYSGKGHALSLINTIGFESGYNAFNNMDKSILYVYNSDDYNIHETGCSMNVKKVPQVCGEVVNSKNGLFDTHIDIYTGPTALKALNSPGLHDPLVDTPRKGNVCPASDVPTDTFSISWTAITSNGCIVQ